MSRPPVRQLTSLSLIALLSAALFVAPAAAQRPETNVSLAGQATGAVLTTIVIGGGFVLLAPDYADRTTRRVREDPIETFLYGFAIGVAALIALVLLFVSVIGILLAIPLTIAMLIVGELGYLAVGRAVTDSWGPALLVAIGASAISGGVPVLGTLLGLVLSSLGFGAAYLEYRDGGRSDRGRRPHVGEPS